MIRRQVVICLWVGGGRLFLNDDFHGLPSVLIQQVVHRPYGRNAHPTTAHSSEQQQVGDHDEESNRSKRARIGHCGVYEDPSPSVILWLTI